MARRRKSASLTPRKPKPGEAAGIGDRALLRDREARRARRPRSPIPAASSRSSTAPRSACSAFSAALPGGGGRLIPVDKKSLGRELAIAPHAHAATRRTANWSPPMSPRKAASGCRPARIKERLGSLKSERAVSLIAIHAHGIPHVFPREAMAEAEAAKPADLSRAARTGAKIPLVTIDPADAKDHDDAVYRRAGHRSEQSRRPYRHRRDRRRRALRDGRAPRSTARRWSAAIRSISRTASCRCCRSAFPTICAR